MPKPPTELIRVDARFAEYLRKQAARREMPVTDFSRRLLSWIKNRKVRGETIP